MRTTSELPDVQIEEPLLLAAYCRQQGRGVRIFDESLAIVWENTPDRLTRYPIYRSHDGTVTAMPEAGPERNAWPVTRVLHDGRRAERTYWIELGRNRGRQCFRVNAWMLPPAAAGGVRIVEETEAMDKRYCPDARIQQLDVELAELIGQVTEIITRRSDPQTLRLRLHNPHLQPCREIKECGLTDCPAHDHPETHRCWELDNTHCAEGMEHLGPLDKFQYCSQCQVFLLACPDPMTRVGENFNRLLSLLQIKYREALQAHAEVQQAEKLATVGEVMLGLAHEIKTPLSVILGRLDCLGLELDSLSLEEVNEDLNVIRSHAVRMHKILEGMLTLARPRPPALRPLSLNHVIREVSGMLAKTLQGTGITLDARLTERLPQVDADATHMQQVLINLLLNARDAMPEGGVLEVRTRSQRRPADRVIVEVRDRGHGIRPEDLSQVFSPFYSTRTAKGGTGLGLAVCQRIMLDHGGRIEVTSKVGEGTTFSLIFPRSREQA